MGTIFIDDPTYEDRRIVTKFSTSKNINKYIDEDELFIEYDVQVPDEESLLSIPLTATILPLAWITGSDIRVKSLDRTFYEAMNRLKTFFRRIHPNIPFTTEIFAENLVDNITGVDGERTGLLFSGGVDSTYSLITNMEKKPILLMLWGIDNYPYPENAKQWGHIYSTYKRQSERIGLELRLVKTNASRILENSRINHDFHLELSNGSIRALIQHSLILLPLMAPLSVGRFNKLLIASSGAADFNYDLHPWGSTPEIDENIVWADLKVKHDGALDRVKKITGPVKDYLIEKQMLLRVCLRRLDKEMLNDSTCEKCLRTIACLTLAGIDPNECGFNVNESTFKSMKDNIENSVFDDDFISEWKPIQQMIPQHLDRKLYGSKDFFDWFREFDLDSNKRNVEIYRDLYNKSPYCIAKTLDSFYKKNGIKIHSGSIKRI